MASQLSSLCKRFSACEPIQHLIPGQGHKSTYGNLTGLFQRIYPINNFNAAGADLTVYSCDSVSVRSHQRVLRISPASFIRSQKMNGEHVLTLTARAAVVLIILALLLSPSPNHLL